MRILLKKGADMQLKDDNGDQPIHLAAEAGHYEYVDIHRNIIICGSGVMEYVASQHSNGETVLRPAAGS